MARRAGDRALVARCYINIPVSRIERGDPATEVAPLYEEGLQLARRDGAMATIAGTTTSFGSELQELGRLDEALAPGERAARCGSPVGR